MPYADVGGVRLSFRQSGQGPDVVLIHGLATSQAFWNLGLVAQLARRFRVTTYDLRGHGYSDLAPHGYLPRDLAGDLAGVMQAAGIERAHLVGHSYGGLVALHHALERPEQVVSLTVADTRIRSLQPRQPMHEEALGVAVREMFAACGVTIADDEPEMGVRLLEALASPRWEGLRNRLGAQVRFVPFAGRRGGRRAAQRWLRLLHETTAGHDVRYYPALPDQAFATLDCPVLALYGERSPNLVTAHRLEQLYPRVRLAIVSAAGHFHPAARPEALVEAVTGFWKSLSGG